MHILRALNMRRTKDMMATIQTLPYSQNIREKT